MPRTPRSSDHQSPLRQIAEAAGVSLSTASIVLNGRGDEVRIAKATQERILECAKKVDYTPNIYARKLRKSTGGKSTKVIGVFWSDRFLNESMGEFFFEAYHTILENHYHIEFSIRFFTPGKLEEVQDQLNPWQFNGIIFCGSTEEDAVFLESLHLDIPIVLSNNAHTSTLSSVAADNLEIGRRCAGELIQRGYTRIGLVNKAQITSGAAARGFGFDDALKRSHIRINPEWNATFDFSDYGAARAEVERIMSLPVHPHAFYAASYDGIAGWLIALREWAQRHGEKPCALIISGYDEKLSALADNVGFADLGIGKFAASSVKMIWMLMNGELDAPAKWLINPVYRVERLKG